MSHQSNVIPLPVAPVGRPLLPAATHAAPYPVKHLGPLRSAVEAAQAQAQAPFAVAAQCALAFASLAVQGFANVETLGGYRPVSLFMMTVALPNERKSTVDSLLSGEVIENSNRACSEPTIDGIFREMSENPSYGLLSDEGGSFLAGYSMRAAQSQRTYATLNSLWDGKQIKLPRKKETLTLRNRRLTSHLMVQPSIAAVLLSDHKAESIGYLPRCLMVEPESKIGTRIAGGTISRDQARAIEFFQMRLGNLFNMPLPKINPDLNDLAPRKLPLSDDAREVLIKVANAIEKLQAPGQDYQGISTFAGKTAEQACRIAGVLTLWRDENAYEVERDDMVSGLFLASYYLKEAQRLMGISAADTDMKLAEALRAWLIARYGSSKEFLTGDVIQLAPQRAMRSKKAVERMLGILEEHGWIRRLPAGHVINGIPRKSAWALR